MRNWEISFTRVIDGVTANYEQVHVSIDRVTGAIVNYGVNLSQVEYPAHKPEVISLDKAKELWFAQFDIKLGYVLESNGYFGPIPAEKYRLMVASGEKFPMNANGELKAKLVYSLIPKHMNREGFLLDAKLVNGAVYHREKSSPWIKSSRVTSKATGGSKSFN